MNVFTGLKSKLMLASIAILASIEAQAVPFSVTSLTGPSNTYLETSPGILSPQSSTVTSINTALSGAGNVELGKYGNVTSTDPAGTRTTLHGSFGTSDTVSVSSLIKSDWTDNSSALAIAYITGAANSIGASLGGGQLAAAVNAFLTLDLNPDPTQTAYAWQRVSDPNVSDVNLIGGHVVVGLDGFLDGSTVLNALFGPGVKAPAGSTASEVVRVDYQGYTKYLYGFSATPTGYSTADGSYNGRFTIPEPSTLTLLGLGFVSASFWRRRKS